MRVALIHFGRQLLGRQGGEFYFLRRDSLHLLHEKSTLRGRQDGIFVIRQSRCQSARDGLEERRVPVRDEL